MPIELVVGAGLALAAVALAVWSVAHLIWAFLGQRGELRSRRLRSAISSFVLAAASVTSIAALYHSVLMVHPTLRNFHPDFDIPYGWATILITLLMLAAIFSASWLVIRWLWRGDRKRLLLATGCVVAFAALGVANYALTHSFQVPAYQRHVMIGSREWKTRVDEAAPDFTVAMLDGSQVSLSELRGKVVLVNFFATWCGPCLNELPHLQELWSDVKSNDDFRMLIVNRGETTKVAAAFKDKNRFTFPIAVDPEARTFKQFAEDGIPRTYLISRDGKILFQTIGYDDMPVYQREFAALRWTIDRELGKSQ